MHYNSNIISKIEIYQSFEIKTEERRIPKDPKVKQRPCPEDWGTQGYSCGETETEWTYKRERPMIDQPYYIAYLSSCINANMMYYTGQESVTTFASTPFVGPKAASPRLAVAGLLDAMALAEKNSLS